MNKAVFLDRDGTIIKEKHFLKDPKDIDLEVEVINALSLLQENGFHLFIITNQSGIARGKLTTEQFLETQEYLLRLLKNNKIHIKAFYFCPHHPSKGKKPFKQLCFCRKPEPGMILQAAKEHNICLKDSFLVGDKVSDVEAGKKVRVKSILVRTGYGSKFDDKESKYKPDYIAQNLLDAVENFIL